MEGSQNFSAGGNIQTFQIEFLFIKVSYLKHSNKFLASFYVHLLNNCGGEFDSWLAISLDHPHALIQSS